MSETQRSDNDKIWVVKRNGEVRGPVSLSQLRRGIKAGKVPPDSEVAEEGSSKWQSVRDLVARFEPAVVLNDQSAAAPPGSNEGDGDDPADAAFPAANARPARARQVRRPRRRSAAFAVAGVLAVGGAAFAAKQLLATKRQALPIVAQKLPPRTNIVGQSRLRPDLDEVAILPEAYVTSALASEACGAVDVAALLSSSRDKDLSVLKATGVLDVTSSKRVSAGLACGDAIRKTITAPSVVSVSFGENDSTFQVGILQAAMDELPGTLGLVRHNFSGLPGQCFKTPEEKADCTDDAQAAFHDGQTWVFGKVAAIEAFARAYTSAHADLTTTVDILQDTIADADETDNIEVTAKPDTIPWTLPCLLSAPVAEKKDFVDACFPKGQGKLLDAIVTKVRGIAIERDILGRAAAYHLAFVLLARDTDTARELQKDLQDLVRDWRAQLSNSEPELTKMIRAKSDYVHDAFWNSAFDPFMRAMRGMSVTRSGATVRVVIHEALRPEETKALKEFVDTRTQDQLATAKVVDAILQGTPVSDKSLAVFLDPDVARWMVLPKASETDCEGFNAKLKSLSTEIPIALFGMKFQMEQRFAKAACIGNALPPESKTCLMSASDLKAFASCNPPLNVFALVASRKLEGQWVAESVEPDLDRLKFLVGSELEFGSTGRVALSMTSGGTGAHDGDAEVKSDDGSSATFRVPTLGKVERASVKFLGDNKIKVMDGQVEITYRRTRFDASLLTTTSK